MKYAWMMIRILLPVASVVLLALSVLEKTANPQLCLSAALLCNSIALVLNLSFGRKKKANHPTQN